MDRVRPQQAEHSGRPPAVVAGEAAAEHAETTQEIVLDPRSAAFFDIDNTIVRGASLFHLARGLAKRKFFTLGDGLEVKTGAKARVYAKSEIKDWIGQRAQAGRLPPQGFPRSGKI